MEEFRQLLLDVWRESCRHVEIGDAVAQAAPDLFRRLPIDLVLVRRLEPTREAIETVAVGLCRPGAVPSHSRSELPSGGFQNLLQWCGRGEVRLAAADDDDHLPDGLVPPGLGGQLLVGPLKGAAAAIGVVILVARPPHAFGDRHLQMLERLLEPFTVWLENDRRLRELSTLREAAEADKRSLLTRMGRLDIVDTIVGQDSGLKPVMERVQLVARTDAPVLILGETGSGKEVVARAIHERSRRSEGPFLRVNCGAIPTELVDSELFGHERGSFTGAVGDRKGWFERADGGTLFLDECGELPAAAQVRLLRILQDGTFERVGGERSTSADVRVVAATHRDLQAMVAAGQFREDLWYRMAVFPLHLPPLRERVEDIPAMAAHFAMRSAKRNGMAPVLPTPDDINLMVGYAWPGNVRELSAVMERAVILGDGKRLEVAKALGAHPETAPPATPPAAPAVAPAAALATGAAPGVAAAADDAASFPTLDEAMARHVELALERTRGRIEGASGAAQLLGINPHTLRARMRKLGVDWNKYRGG